MEDWEPNKDEQKARRVAELAVYLMNAKVPVPSSQIHSKFYEWLDSDDSFDRAFNRDRAGLAACGLVLDGTIGAGGEKYWQVDAARSYSQGATLGAADAALLALLCGPLLSDGTFPLAEDLGFALAKVYDEFDGTAAVSGGTRDQSRVEKVLRSCLEARHAMRMDYVRADGTRVSGVVAPYGTFGLRGRLYVVAQKLSGDGTPVVDGMRTYRVERIKKATELAKVTFEVPGDFCVADWRRLPFQMGPAVFRGTFEVASELEAEVRRQVGAAGTFFSPGKTTKEEGSSELTDKITAASSETRPLGGILSVNSERAECGKGRRGEKSLLLEADVADATDAAAWAISVGARPVAQQELVDAWRGHLEGVIARG